MNINKAKEVRNTCWCYCYTVYWKEHLKYNRETWSFATFPTKKEAKIHARKMWKEYKATNLKPYILESVAPCSFFTMEEFERLTIIDEEKVGYYYARRIQ